MWRIKEMSDKKYGGIHENGHILVAKMLIKEMKSCELRAES